MCLQGPSKHMEGSACHHVHTHAHMHVPDMHLCANTHITLVVLQLRSGAASSVRGPSDCGTHTHTHAHSADSLSASRTRSSSLIPLGGHRSYQTPPSHACPLPHPKTPEQPIREKLQAPPPLILTNDGTLIRSCRSCGKIKIMLSEKTAAGLRAEDKH